MPCLHGGVCVAAGEDSDREMPSSPYLRDVVNVDRAGESRAAKTAALSGPSSSSSSSFPSPGVCQCPLGFVGEFCERPVEVQVRVDPDRVRVCRCTCGIRLSLFQIPRFMGTSHLTYFGLGASSSFSMLTNDIQIVFK